MNALDIERCDSGNIEDALEVRRLVFVVGQGIPLERDRDGLDDVAEHYVGYVSAQPVAAARLRVLNPESSFGSDAKIERVSVLKEHQGKGIGDAIMQHILDELESRPGIKLAILSSQVNVMEFYRRLGFIPTGEVFDDAGIVHKKMERTIH